MRPRAILAPEKDFEFMGQSVNVVFTNGTVLEDDGTIRIYYGAADQCVGLVFAKLDDLIRTCLGDSVV